MTDHEVPLVDPRWPSCEIVGRSVGSMEGAPTPFMGPLRDYEGDQFALYTDGIVVFIMFWTNNYSPTNEALG